MKISLNWVNRYLARPVTEAEFSAILPPSGFPVEGCDPQADGDFKLEVEVTSNRPDMLCHIGVARELSAKSGIALKLPAFAVPAATAAPVASVAKVAVQTGECALYTARVIKGVKVGPSPAWLKTALENIGLRSISNVVDVTNFVMFETGQPLHAFDLAKLAGGQVVVREAKPEGEDFLAIDGSKHSLKAPMLVIADANQPVAIAGVMGGKDSEVTDATTDILLESALFEPLSVRRTSRQLRMGSDSSYRFERCPDPAGVERASRRAAALILEVAGGSLHEGLIRVGAADPADAVVALRPQKTRDLLGLEVSDAEQKQVLESLGLAVTVAADALRVAVPSRRADLSREVDLIEEVARLVGMDRIPELPTLPIKVRATQPKVEARRLIGAVLAAHGFHETITPSLVPEKAAKAFSGKVASLHGDKGARKEGGQLRSSVLAGLMACRKLNADAGNSEVKLFELAACWEQAGAGVAERRSLALLADGGPDVQLALRELRAVVEALVEALAGAPARARLQVKPIAGDPQAPQAPQAGMLLDGAPLGTFGVVAPAVRKAFELPGALLFADLHAEALLALYPPTRASGALPRFPAIDRDLSVVCDEALHFETLAGAVRQANPALLEDVSFITTYRNAKAGAFPGPGKKSVSLRMQFRDPERTLRHEEVDGQVAHVVAQLKAVGAELRG